MVDSNKSESIRELLFLMGYVAFVFIMLLYTSFVEGGALVDYIFQKNIFYTSLFAIGLIIIVTYILLKINNKSELLEGVNIHEPEESPLFNKIKSSYSIKNMTFGCIIIFSIIGLFGALTNTFFAQTPLEQQFTNTGKVLSSSYPGAPAETLFFLALFFTGIIVINAVVKRYNLPKETRISLIFVLILLLTAGWWGFHNLKYGDSDLNSLSVIIFGFGALLLTYVTGSIIPFLMWHDINNLTYKLNELFGDQRVILVTVIIIAVVIILWALTLRRKKIIK